VSEDFEIKYSFIDKLLHDLAFRFPRLQRNIAEHEDERFEAELAGLSADTPVFIAGLPRAGTTLVLNLLYNLDEFATHCYRDMPFVLTPVLWSRFSFRFKKTDELRERAHGDGMLVNLDSPEAFEEMLWKPFFPKHYQSDRIVPWDADEPSGFPEFFRSHVKKIIFIRGGDASTRYISKNNLNISRLAYLQGNFPAARLVLPFRDPVQHAYELHTQHRHFLDIHGGDPFTRRYMAGVGHYDFGENLRPVDFDGWLERRRTRDTLALDFWLEYWIAAYTHILKHTGENARLLCYEDLCRDAGAALDRIAGFVGVREKQALLDQAGSVWELDMADVKLEGVSGELLEQARELYARLRISEANLLKPGSAGEENLSG
jgi:hypothetical protein